MTSFTIPGVSPFTVAETPDRRGLSSSIDGRGVRPW
jgi:hypothetical protein